MKHEFKLSPTGLMAYCVCGYFAIEGEEGAKMFHERALEAFERHLEQQQEHTLPEPPSTG